jgi:hypothetical protein
MRFDKKCPPSAQRITRTELVRGEAGSAGTDQGQVCGPLPGAPQGGPSPKNMSNNVDESMTDNLESDTLTVGRSLRKLLLQALMTVLAAILICRLASAEKGIVWLHVVDLRDVAVPGVALATSGPGTEDTISDSYGHVRLAVGSDTEAGDSVHIELVQPTKQFVISPWNGIIIVPSFADKPDNFFEIRVAPKGVRAVLKDPRVLATIVARADRAQAPSLIGEPIKPRGAAIHAQAEELGLDRGEASMRY